MKALAHRLIYKLKYSLASRYDLVHLKRLAFMLALITCLSSGSILLFSLFSSGLRHSAGLTYTQINMIASSSAIGMYLCLPVLGYLADCYGPALLSLISIWAFCPAYFVNAVLVKQSPYAPDDAAGLSPKGVMVMAVSFCFIGLATSSLFFSSLITCAKIFPHHKGLAISLPVTCYGVSSLIGAQILKLKYFHRSKDVLDLYKVFSFFAVLYLVVGVLNLFSNTIVTIEQDVIFGEREPLLPAADDEDTMPLTPQRSAIEPPNHRERYVKFLKDKSAWICLLALFFSTGPLESFQNNLSSIIESAAQPTVHLSDQVSVFAASSTASRLLMGVSSDWLSSENRKHPVSKMWFLLFLTVLGAAGQFAPLFHVDFNYVTLLSGVCYGGTFTTYPTVIASIWGVDLLGSTWGSFMVAPAFGSITYSLLHGQQRDVCSPDVGRGTCLDRYFKVSGLSLCLSFLCILLVWRMWWSRELRVL